ncbi:MAG: hypothetical protein AAF990_22355 [Bacteroidota bacterium]
MNRLILQIGNWMFLGMILVFWPSSKTEFSPVPLTTANLPVIFSSELTPFECTPNFYQVIRSNGMLVRYNALDLAGGWEVINRFGYRVDALAYNPVDNFMYAIRFSDDHLLRIGQDGNFQDLGSLDLPNLFYHVGEFDPQGRYYIKGIGKDASDELAAYRIDMVNETIDLISTSEVFKPGDWSYNYADDHLYGVDRDTLYRLNPITGNIDKRAITGILDYDLPSFFGSAMSAANGTLFVYNQGSGNIYRIEPESSEAILVSRSLGEGIFSDGASCPFADAPLPLVVAKQDAVSTFSNESVRQQIDLNDFAFHTFLDLESVRPIQAAAHGVADFSNGTLEYAPEPDYYGYDTLVYEICSTDDPTLCDQTEIFIEVIPIVSIAGSICEGASYVFAGSEYTQAGSYADTLASTVGVDSIIQLNLEVNTNPRTTVEAEICQGGAFDIWGRTYEYAGYYDAIFPSAKGCDSTVTLYLQVEAAPRSTIEAQICQGSEFEYQGFTYRNFGYYDHILKTADGCDSIVTLFLQVDPPIETNLSATICQGTTYDIWGTSFDRTGDYGQVLQTAEGCDSIVRLRLDVLPPPIEFLQANICEGESFQLGAATYTQSGLYQQTVKTAEGCDSTLTLDLFVEAIQTTVLNEQICIGERFQLGNEIYNQTGSYQQRLTSVSGCDSLVELNLRVNDISQEFLDLRICEGEQYTIGSNTFSQSGSYREILTAATGCDSIVDLQLTVLPVAQTATAVSICEGETYRLGNAIFSQAGIYEEIFVAENGCDSVVQLDLSVRSISESIEEVAICQGQSYAFGGTSLMESGSYQERYTAANGCDSFANLVLEVLPILESNLQVSICTGTAFEIANRRFEQTGQYEIALITAEGCDSLVYLDLEVTPEIVEEIDAVICQGASYNFGGVLYDESGRYEQRLTTAAGCDSLVRLDLSVASEIVEEIDAVICQGASYNFGGVLYDESGRYEQRLTTLAGCDSLVRLDLSVASEIVEEIDALICQGASYNFGGVLYHESGRYEQRLTTAAGCDSLVRLDLSVASEIVEEIDAVICQGASYDFGGVLYDESGRYEQRLTTSAGCDSLIYLDLEVADAIVEEINASICEGASYNFGGQLLQQAGRYEQRLTTTEGCDSLAILALEVLDATETFLDVAICEGEGITIGAENYTQSGTYRQRLTASNGCDSLVELTLDVNPLPEPEIAGPDVICNGASVSLSVGDYASYEWSTGADGRQLTVNRPGWYYVTVTDANGCTAVTGKRMGAGSSPRRLDLFSRDPSSCGKEDGSISILSQLDPFENYLYSIDGGQSWSNRSSFRNLAAGTYEVLISNTAKTCFSRYPRIVVLSAPTAPTIESVVVNQPGNCTYENGSIRILASGGEGQYQYSISGGKSWSNQSVFTDLKPGVYLVVIRNRRQKCPVKYEQRIILQAPRELSVQIEDVFSPLCEGDTGGGALAVATGGVEPYTYRWSNGFEEAELTNAPPGIYEVTVTDANNCSGIAAVQIAAPDPFSIELSPKKEVTYCFGQTAILNAGDTIHQYSWGSDNGFTSSDPLVRLTEPGTYWVSAVNENGCEARDTLTIDFTEEFFGADFLISGEGIVNNPIVAAEISWPIPDSIRWEYNTDSIEVQQQLSTQEVLSFPNPGRYKIRLYAYKNGCEVIIDKYITIYRTAAELTNPDNIKPAFTQVLEFAIFPNPNDGRFTARVVLTEALNAELFILLGNGEVASSRKLNGASSYIESFDISGAVPGIYALARKTPSEWKYFNFIKE